MSLKKITTVLVACGLAVNLVGCTSGSSASKNKMANNDISDSTSMIQPVSSFSGEVLTPEEELALLNQKVVHFAYDDSTINTSDQRVLSVHAKYMLEHPSIALRIKGHTDERGSRDYNIALGERRAKSVERYLETKGVPSNRLVTVSYGKEQPLNPESNEAAWAENRRAELDYEDIG